MRILFLLLFSFSTLAQDLYNFENSKKYGEYLLKSGQYELAGKEYERLVFFTPESDTLKTQLLKSYRLSNQTNIGVFRTKQLYPEAQTIPYAPALEYAKLLMQNKDWEGAKIFWNNNQSFKPDDKTIFNTTSEIFNNDFKAARKSLESIQNKDFYVAEGYKTILEKETHKKSPAFAGIMSAVVPGTGKAYSNNWRDGLVSLFFTAGMAFQSYRNFNKHGVKNYRGWVYGGIGFGFYLGNIYGSVKSTKEYNKKKINKLQHEASDIFNSYY